MTRRAQRLLAPGDLLPGMALVEAGTGRTVSWCRSNEASVVVFPHPGDCGACRAYLGRLADVAAELASWGARPLAVLPATDDGGDEPPSWATALPFPVLADRGGDARRRCGVEEPGAAVLLADRWGAVVESAGAVGPGESGGGGGHDFIAPAVLVRRATTLGIQCPECGVPDGGWATVSPVPLG